MKKFLFMVALFAYGCSGNPEQQNEQRKMDSLQQVADDQNKLPPVVNQPKNENPGKDPKNNPAEAAKEKVKNNISSLVTCSAEVTPQSIGPFSKVYLTAVNKSDYKIDSYKILCEYSDGNGVKTQTLDHTFVLDPQASVTFQMADCDKKGGVTVQVVEIKSAALGL